MKGDERIRVGVAGALGRMGTETCRAIAGADDMVLTTAIDPQFGADGPGAPVGSGVLGVDVARCSSIDSLDPSSVDVIVDFTVPGVAKENLEWCASNGVHAVAGTSGFSEGDLADLERKFAGKSCNCLIAPNFALGGVLMMKFSQIAARYLEDCEIIELHHDRKADAPSGTALATIKLIEESRGGRMANDPTRKILVEGARGGKSATGIPIHSVRLKGLVAHQEVIFGSEGETLTIRHDSIDRKSFMPGVMLGVRSVADHPGLTFGLENFLTLGMD